MIRRLASAACAVGAALVMSAALASSAHAQQPTIRIDDLGPGEGPALLGAAVAQPHTVVTPARNAYLFPGGDTVSRTAIVLGRNAIVEGTVHGDVIVVAGDLYMHPGGHIDGRAMAFGGGVYESSLATIGGGPRAFRDFTYDITAVPGGYALRYRALNVETVPTFALAGFYGVSIPTYDRSNGLSLPIGIDVTPAALPVVLAPRITYRSQLGRIDPSMTGAFALGRHDTVSAFVGRGTFSNDTWIRSDLINSGLFLLTGDDARNYFRASRAEATIDHMWEFISTTVHTYVGGRAERAASVRPGLDPQGGPWTFIGRHDAGDALRPNPPIDGGSTYSGLGGISAEWNGGDIAAHGTAGEEIGSGVGRAFAQTTVDGGIEFPTFGTQSLSFTGHAVITAGHPPRQRYGYLGGPGSLSTLKMLDVGGDQLAFFDARYNIPIDQFQVPFIGSPVVTLSEALGGAGVGRVPVIHQASGVRLGVGFFYAEFMVDPARRHGHLSAGISTRR